MEKVKITQEQAKSFETFRKDQYTNQMIVEMVTGNANGFVVVTLRELAKNHYDKFLQALVNGYEVEETPEDKVREYYLIQKAAVVSDLSHDKPTTAIKYVLELLNIKIDGIN